MSTTSDIANSVQDRLEEPRGPGIFWQLTNEILPVIAEGLNEGTLLSGEPEIRSTSNFTPALNSTLQVMPAGSAAILRVEAGNAMVRKSSLLKMDYLIPGWEAATDSSLGNVGKMVNWFPVGLNQFGIYPQLTVPINVVITYIGLPLPSGFPFTGYETIPMQQEFNSAFADSAACRLRLKEGGAEFEQGLFEFDSSLDKLTALGAFGYRKGSLRITRAMGMQAAITDVERR
jgi:hypothetical protein